MSFSAKRFPPSIRSHQRLSDQRLSEALFEEGYEFVDNRLEDLLAESGQISQNLADKISRLGYGLNDEDFLKMTHGRLSKGAFWIAQRIHRGAEPDLRQLASDYAAYKELWAWKSRQSAEYLESMDLDNVGRLFHIGIRFAWQADRFCELYSQVCDTERPWGSCFQPSKGKVKAIAFTPNYNRLPMWVKREMTRAHAYVQTERVGDIWRLKNCARAWKWSPTLPKNIAEKVGKLSPKARVIAALSWAEIEKCGYSRTELASLFWAMFQKLHAAPALSLAEKVRDAGLQFFEAMELLLGLPYGTIEREDVKKCKPEYLDNLILNYLSPTLATLHLFGCSGKATVRAFQSSHRQAVKWASALAYGHADAVQQILTIADCVEFQEDAVYLLKSLGWRSALRLIQKTEFRYRGEVQSVSDYHVRDTGYLWNQIKSKPVLGRVRCWNSLHNQLAAAYVAELPDAEIKTPEGWGRVDGLCSVAGVWSLKLPHRINELKLWGELMHNCIGGYGDAVNSGRSAILAVLEGGKLTHCVEIDPRYGEIRQFLGNGNSRADQSVELGVTQALKQANLIQ